LETALADFPGTILCVSHDRYFLNKLTTRMFILDPPKLIDFDGGYGQWVQKQSAKPPSQPPPPKAAVKKQQQHPKPKEKKDNPYARPFGRLSIGDLERQIADTEKALKICQSNFADAQTMRDPAGQRRLQSEHDSVAAKLKALEAEYFARGGG
jgi:ATP-binding cassette subfamily F protein 3